MKCYPYTLEIVREVLQIEDHRAASICPQVKFSHHLKSPVNTCFYFPSWVSFRSASRVSLIRCPYDLLTSWWAGTSIAPWPCLFCSFTPNTFNQCCHFFLKALSKSKLSFLLNRSFSFVYLPHIVTFPANRCQVLPTSLLQLVSTIRKSSCFYLNVIFQFHFLQYVPLFPHYSV